MNFVERLRIEKAAADCGFEMTPLERDGGLELRSAHFPETVTVYQAGELAFAVAMPAGIAPLTSDVPVRVDGFERLYELLRAAAARGRTLPNRVADAFRKATAYMPRTTEMERVIVARIGQTMFRAALLDYWQGRCCVTGLDVPELLRASHIKPWASCDKDDERLDVFNGLLLAPQFDALFDAGWMTVEATGIVRLSPTLSDHAKEALGVDRPMALVQVCPAHLRYLEFHRQRIFRG